MLKQFLKSLFSCTLGIFIFSLVVLPVQAQETTGISLEEQAEIAALPVDESPRVERTPLFFTGNNISLEEEVYAGPVFVFGSQVTVDSDVYGDVVVAGGSVTLNGRMQQDVYAAGGTVLITGEVYGNVIVAGGEVQFGPEALVSESVLVTGENVVMDGSVLHQMYVGARRLELTGSVNDMVQVMAEEVVVQDDASVGGMITGQTTSEVVVAESANVAGGVEVEIIEETPRQTQDSLYWWMGKVVVTMVSFSLVMVLAVATFGKKLSTLSLHALHEWKSSIMTGISLVLGISFVSLILAFTVIGVKAAFILMVLVVALCAIGWSIPAFFFGQWMLPKQSLYLQAIVGGSVAAIVVSIPVLGWIFGTLLSVFGAGALFQAVRK